MFVCKLDAPPDLRWTFGMGDSYGPCEVCHRAARCKDIPHERMEVKSVSIIVEGEDGKLFVDGQPIYLFRGELAYIDPSGVAPDGIKFPKAHIPTLLDREWITINYRDNPEDDVLGYGFQIVGDDDDSELIAIRIFDDYGGE